MDAVITEGREILGFDVQDRLQTYVDRYRTGISVRKVNIDTVGPPAAVQDGFDDVQKAQEDEERTINEANAYAEQVVPEARGKAQRQIEEANAYRDQVIAQAEGDADRFTKLLKEYAAAPDVTRERLYIEAMEQVYANVGMVVVDVEGGNNLLYLPLDQLRRQPGFTAAGPSLSDVSSSMDTSNPISSMQTGRTSSSRTR